MVSRVSGEPDREATQIVQQHGDFVAITRNGSFDRLVDGRAIIERTARQAVAGVDR
jgi:hypothetical protein